MAPLSSANRRGQAGASGRAVGTNQANDLARMFRQRAHPSRLQCLEHRTGLGLAAHQLLHRLMRQQLHDRQKPCIGESLRACSRSSAATMSVTTTRTGREPRIRATQPVAFRLSATLASAAISGDSFAKRQCLVRFRIFVREPVQQRPQGDAVEMQQAHELSLAQQFLPPCLRGHQAEPQRCRVPGFRATDIRDAPIAQDFARVVIGDAAVTLKPVPGAGLRQSQITMTLSENDGHAVGRPVFPFRRDRGPLVAPSLVTPSCASARLRPARAARPTRQRRQCPKPRPSTTPCGLPTRHTAAAMPAAALGQTIPWTSTCTPTHSNPPMPAAMAMLPAATMDVAARVEEVSNRGGWRNGNGASGRRGRADLSDPSRVAVLSRPGQSRHVYLPGIWFAVWRREIWHSAAATLFVRTHPSGWPRPVVSACIARMPGKHWRNRRAGRTIPRLAKTPRKMAPSLRPAGRRPIGHHASAG